MRACNAVMLLERVGQCKGVVRLVFVAAACVQLFGCAIFPSATPEEEVGARAGDYWRAVIAGDWERAYSYTSPSYREAVDLFNYRRKYDGFVKYKEADLLSVSCDGPELCKAKLKVSALVALDHPFETNTVIEDRWLRDGSGWFRYVER